MLTALSILVSSALAGFLLCLLKIIKINKVKKTNLAEPVNNKKWRFVWIYLMIVCLIFIIVGIALYFALNIS